MSGYEGSWNKGTWTLHGQLPTIQSKAKEVKAVLTADRWHRSGPEPQLVTKMIHMPRFSSVLQYTLAKHPEHMIATRDGNSQKDLRPTYPYTGTMKESHHVVSFNNKSMVFMLYLLHS